LAKKLYRYFPETISDLVALMEHLEALDFQYKITATIDDEANAGAYVYELVSWY
jgi:hypothetical protein